MFQLMNARLRHPRSRALGLLTVVAVALAALGIAHVQTPRPRERIRVEAYTHAGAAMQHFIEQRLAVGSTELPVERYRLALERRDEMQRAQAPLSRQKNLRAWRFLGPDQVGGRTRALLIDSVEPELMYAGSASGGIYKSTDGGLSWASTGDQLANLATSALAMDPNDHRVLYAGTGEGVYVERPVTRSRGVRGDGIFVSRDAGANWRQLEATRGQGDFDYVNDLLFDFDGRLLAATRTGVWLSEDQGTSFRKLFTPTNLEGCSDLAVSAATRRLLVSCGVHSAGGVYVSSDGGNTWSATINRPETGRSSLAVAPSDTRIVYALTADPFDYGMRRVSRSNDGGANWQTRAVRGGDVATSLLLTNSFAANSNCTSADTFAGQGWFDNALAVDPTNPEIVWAGGVDLYRSDNGGRNFRYASRWELDTDHPQYAHPDQHAIVFHPRYDGSSNQRLFVGNDGGVFETRTPYAATSANPCNEAGVAVVWEARNRGYWATQFYHGALSADGSVLVAGAQDNGTHKGTSASQDWTRMVGGDGGYAAIDPRDPRVLYLSYTNASFERSTDGGDNFTTITNGLGVLSERNYLFIAPLALDTARPDVLYTGGQRLMRTENQGTLWVPVSPLGLDPQSGLVSAIAIAANQSDTVVFGTSSGAIARSLDATSATPTWLLTRPQSGFVSSVTIDPANPQRVFATYSNFGGSKVFRSLDGGASWVAIDGEDPRHALPDVPVHSLLVDPGDSTRLLLGTDIGLFIGVDNGARWYADQSGLGNVLIEHLQASPAAGGGYDVTAFTYGRGAFRANLAALPKLALNPGLSGLWYEPATNGQGLQIEVNRTADALVAAWYTFAPTSSPASRTQLLWLVGSASFADGIAEVPMVRSRGGQFDAGSAAAVDQVGTLRVEFDDCSRASASYAINLDGRALTGEIPLTRLTADVACERFRQYGAGAESLLPPPATPGGIQYGHSGSWFDASRPGQGFLVEADPLRALMAITWFTYDPADPRADGSQSPLWLVASGNIVGASAETTLYLTLGGGFDQTAPPAAAPLAVGSLRFSVLDCSTATASYSLALPGATPRSGNIALTRVTTPDLCR